MNTEKNRARALRYRRLALSEVNKENASLLHRIADEAEQGVLYTVQDVGSSPASIKIFISAAERRHPMAASPWPATDDHLLLMTR
jgi:hypothetical protein